MDFKINYGPWETIFIGKFFGHDVEVVMNTEKYFLTIIYEKKEGTRIGALVDGYKAFSAKGSVDAFVSSIPNKCLAISKSNGEKTFKMIFIPFEPVYIDFKQEDFTRKVDNAIKKSYDDIGTVIELAKSASISLKETSMAPETEYAPILGDPFMARSLLSGLKKTAMELIDLSGTNTRKGNTIQLGLNKNRTIITEETDNLNRTIIIGPKDSVNYSMHIIAETFLLDNTQTIIFDQDNYFIGLGEASQNEKELKEDLVDYEPAGFPIKKFIAKEDIQIPLKNIDLKMIFEIMNLKDKEFLENFEKIKVDSNTPLELIEKINQSELSDFHKLKAQRLLHIIEKSYPSLFGEKTSIDEIIKEWPGNIGRAAIINIKELNNEEKLIFEQGLLEEISKKISQQKKDIIIFIPEIDKLINKNNKIIDKILTLQNQTINFVIGSTKNIASFENSSTAKIEIVNKRDVAISIKNKRNYRVNLRPSISKSSIN